MISSTLFADSWNSNSKSSFKNHMEPVVRVFVYEMYCDEIPLMINDWDSGGVVVAS